MKAFIEWLKRKVAGKEMEKLRRYEILAWQIDDWLADYLDSTVGVGSVRSWVEDDDDNFALDRAGQGIRARLHHAQTEGRKDAELLDFLERHAVVTYSYDRAAIEIDVPDEFDGANTIREIIEAARKLEEEC